MDGHSGIIQKMECFLLDLNGDWISSLEFEFVELCKVFKKTLIRILLKIGCLLKLKSITKIIILD